MKKILSLIGVLFILGCAGAALNKDMKEKRGYTDADITEINAATHPYMEMLSRARTAGNKFNTTEKVNAENRIKSIWCACVKKLGPKCRQKPEGLSADDKAIWLKGNAAERSLMGMAASDDPFSSTPFMLDEAECQ